MPAFQVPEIMRVPLEELVLQIHLLKLGSASEFLPELLQPPPQKAVDAAVSSLQTIGACHHSPRTGLASCSPHLHQVPALLERLEQHLDSQQRYRTDSTTAAPKRGCF